MKRLVLRAASLLAALSAAAPPAAADPAEAGVAEVLAAAHAQVGVTRVYDPAWRRIDFPNGDVPADRGVCADVVVRAWRAIGIDLQVEVNRDMRAHFAAYPRIWGLRKPDPNIDHRRVPNLETFLGRHADVLAATTDPAHYLPGDLVSWRLERGEPHIGIVSDQRSADGARPLVVHNVGAGTRLEDALLRWPPVGHFRYFPASAAASRRDGTPAARPAATSHRVPAA